jgi:hypothetical protein
MRLLFLLGGFLARIMNLSVYPEQDIRKLLLVIGFFP